MHLKHLVLAAFVAACSPEQPAPPTTFTVAADTVTAFEVTAAEMVAAWEQATADLPQTERLDLEVVI